MFVDVSEHDLLAGAAQFEGLRAADLDAIIAVDLYGRVAVSRTLAELCRGRGWQLVEDASQALGAERITARSPRVAAAGAEPTGAVQPQTESTPKDPLGQLP